VEEVEVVLLAWVTDQFALVQVQEVEVVVLMLAVRFALRMMSWVTDQPVLV
jgi:hypothetical protein